MILGFDVSHHQGAVNFAAARQAGRDFCVIKASEGVGYADPVCGTYRAQAHAAGLVVGLYHFARAGDPAAEAAYGLKTVGALQVGEFLVLDWEVPPPPGGAPAWCKAWLDAVARATGVAPLIYMNQTAARGSDWSAVASAYGLWLAAYDNAPGVQTSVPYWGGCAMKQYSDRGSVLGVTGGVDVNAFYGTTTQLLAYGKQPPLPKPRPATPKEDDMRLIQQTDRGIALVGPGYFRGLAPAEVSAANALYGPAVVYSSAADWDIAKAVCVTGVTEGFGQLLGEVHGKVVDSVFGLEGRPGPAADDLLGHTLTSHAILVDLYGKAGQAVNVDAAAVADALAASDTAIDKLADAIAAKIATRLGNG